MSERCSAFMFSALAACSSLVLPCPSFAQESAPVPATPTKAKADPAVNAEEKAPTETPEADAPAGAGGAPDARGAVEAGGTPNARGAAGTSEAPISKAASSAPPTGAAVDVSVAPKTSAVGDVSAAPSASPAAALRNDSTARVAVDASRSAESNTVAGVESDPTPTFTVRARVMTGFEKAEESPRGAQADAKSESLGFFVKQVRLGVKGQLAKRLRVNVSFDVADGFESSGFGDPPAYVRTAVLEYRVSKALRLKAGRFKRAFSNLEKQGAGDLPIIGRGLLNNQVIEKNEWGDRAVGMSASGRFKPAKLRWAISVTNPYGRRAAVASEGVDVMARVSAKPLPWLKLGVNAGRKQHRVAPGDIRRGYGYGGDVTLRAGGAELQVEVTHADMVFNTLTPAAMGGLVLASYRFDLNEAWYVKPMVFAEYADFHTKVTQNEATRYVAGVNIGAYESLRIMPQVEFVRPVGEVSAINPWTAETSYMLMLSMGM